MSALSRWKSAIQGYGIECAIMKSSLCPRFTSMKVLLAVDGSEGSRVAAASVASRPWPEGTEVRVLSAVELNLTALQAAFEIPVFDSDRLE